MICVDLSTAAGRVSLDRFSDCPAGARPACDLRELSLHVGEEPHCPYESSRHASRERLGVISSNSDTAMGPFEWKHLHLYRNDVSHTLLRDIGIDHVEGHIHYIRLWMEAELKSTVLQLDHHEKYYARMTVDEVGEGEGARVGLGGREEVCGSMGGGGTMERGVKGEC